MEEEKDKECIGGEEVLNISVRHRIDYKDHQYVICLTDNIHKTNTSITIKTKQPIREEALKILFKTLVVDLDYVIKQHFLFVEKN